MYISPQCYPPMYEHGFTPLVPMPCSIQTFVLHNHIVRSSFVSFDRVDRNQFHNHSCLFGVWSNTPASKLLTLSLHPSLGSLQPYMYWYPMHAPWYPFHITNMYTITVYTDMLEFQACWRTPLHRGNPTVTLKVQNSNTNNPTQYLDAR